MLIIMLLGLLGIFSWVILYLCFDSTRWSMLDTRKFTVIKLILIIIIGLIPFINLVSFAISIIVAIVSISSDDLELKQKYKESKFIKFLNKKL